MNETSVNAPLTAKNSSKHAKSLERIAHLAQLSTGSDIALLSVFDELRASAGLADDLSSAEIEFTLNLCARPVADQEFLHITDVAKSSVVKASNNPGEFPNLGAFTASPIWIDGVRIGTLAVVNTEPRDLDTFEQATLRDLTALAAEHIAHTRALEKAEGRRDRDQRVLQVISDGVITVSEFGYIKRINRAAEAIFGYADREIKGQRISLHPRDGLWLAARGGDATPDVALPDPPDIASFMGHSRIIRGFNKDGEALVLELTVAEVELKSERAFVLSVRNTTELHRAQLLLRQHAFIVEKTESAVLITDSEHRIEWCNKGFEEISGYHLADIQGQKPSEMLWSNNTSAETLRAINESIVNKRSYNEEMIWLRSNGHPYWVAVEAHPICEMNGDLVKYVSLGFDITDRKRNEQMKNDFVTMVSHELRTPLTVIAGTIEAMMDGIAGPMPELADELLIMGKRNCVSLENLIDDLLDINQLEAGIIKMHERNVDIDALCAQVIGSMQTIAEEAGLTMKAIPSESPLYVHSDAERITQVLTNLIGNAIKFSPPGTTVAVSSENREGWVRVKVTDEGPGIKRSFRSKLFEMFSRAPEVIASGKEGFGLGLCISKGLMDQMGGRIDFEAAQLGGSQFYFELPLAGDKQPDNSPKAADSDQKLVSSVQA